MAYISQFFPIIGTTMTILIFLILKLKCFILKDEETWKQLMLSSMRITLGLILILAGNEKITGLNDIIGPNYLITELEKYSLGLFGYFIALSQFIIGFILLTNRLGVLGEIMALPLFLNILIVTISLKWTRATSIVVGYFVIIDLILIFSNWHRVKFLISQDITEVRNVPIVRKDFRLDIIYLSIFFFMLIGLFLYHINSELSKIVIKGGFLLIFLIFLFDKKIKR